MIKHIVQIFGAKFVTNTANRTNSLKQIHAVHKKTWFPCTQCQYQAKTQEI